MLVAIALGVGASRRATSRSAARSRSTRSRTRSTRTSRTARTIQRRRRRQRHRARVRHAGRRRRRRRRRATRGAAVGAAIAYNYIGGSFDIANPDVVNRTATATDQITAYIDNATVTAGGDVDVSAGYAPPTTPLPTSVSVGPRPSGRRRRFVARAGGDARSSTTSSADARLERHRRWLPARRSPSRSPARATAPTRSRRSTARRIRLRASTTTSPDRRRAPNVISARLDRPAATRGASRRGRQRSRRMSASRGAAAADDFALGGSISINVIAHSISAYITGTRAVKADGSVKVEAVDDVQVDLVRGRRRGRPERRRARGVALQIDKSQRRRVHRRRRRRDARGGGSGAGPPVANGTKGAADDPVKGIAVTATRSRTSTRSPSAWPARRASASPARRA